jgi:D-glycero-beta-D-manno-heptose 1-phosphate adenylyltransferase
VSEAEAVQPSAGGTAGKVLSLDELAVVRRELAAAGRTVVFTNGHFDLLHVGHVRYLQAARTLGDCLIVGLNGDASTTALKGPGRPLVPQEERAELLAALACVDYVTIFDELTAERLVAALRPDIYVKGGDYAEGKPLPEAAVVAAYGGRVELVDLTNGRSTTNLIHTILSRLGPSCADSGATPPHACP